ncbi:MAG UNVERIFIED_CONTAM: hypothetical protein LVR29_20680, partial [Microcystis novacekii LVE1205-3]
MQWRAQTLQVRRMLSPQSRTLHRPISEVWPLMHAAIAAVGRQPRRPSRRRSTTGWSAHPGRAPRALVLGATPELWVSGLAGPLASVSMVEPGPRSARAHDLAGARDLATGRALGHRRTRPTGWFDIVLCDAGLHTLAYPNVQSNLRRHLAARDAHTGSLLAVQADRAAGAARANGAVSPASCG